jgi:hypothetical protein
VAIKVVEAKGFSRRESRKKSVKKMAKERKERKEQMV